MVEQIGRSYSLLFQRGLVYSGDLPSRDQQAVGEVPCDDAHMKESISDVGTWFVPFDLDSPPFSVPSLRNQIVVNIGCMPQGPIIS